MTSAPTSTETGDRSPIPERLHGLAPEEAAARAARGVTNRAPTDPSHAVGAIVRANVLTRFNAVVGTLLLVVLVVGSPVHALFGVVPVVNTAVGIGYELRARRLLDRAAATDAPPATVVRGGRRQLVPADEVVLDDVVELEPGAPVVADGEVLAADALEIDESPLTGASLPEGKQAGAVVRAGSFATAGRGWYRADRVGPDAEAHRLTREAYGLRPIDSELRRATDRILTWTAALMVPVAVLLAARRLDGSLTAADARGVMAALVAMVPEGLVLLTTVVPAVAAVRLSRRRVLVRRLAAVDALARVDVLCIDKTGTLTEPMLDVVELSPVAPDGTDPTEAARSAREVLGALAWSDPDPNATMSALAVTYPSPGWQSTWRLAFSPARQFSGSGFSGRGDWVLGAPDVLLAYATDPAAARSAATLVAPRVERGDRVLLLARLTAPPPRTAPADPTDAVPRATPVAVVSLQERIRDDAARTLDLFRERGVDIKVVSGDDPRTVAAVARRLELPEAGEPVDAGSLPDDRDDLADRVDDAAVLGRARPDHKRAVIEALRARGHTVAMIGDGVNDVPALAAADIGVALGSGSAAARRTAPLVLPDASFADLPAVLAEGRRAIAGVERVADLFVAKTVYITLLALAVGLAGPAFPFLPAHLVLLGTLAVGTPAVVLALTDGDRVYVPGFVNRVLRWALPAGTVAAAATVAAYVLVLDGADSNRTEARTVATVTLFLIVAWLLVLLGRPLSRARTAAVAVPAAAFTLILAVPGLRTLFDLELGSPLVVLSAVGVAAIAAVALELGWQVSGATAPHRPTTSHHS